MKWRKNDNLNFICSWLNGSVVVFLLLLGGLSWWHSEESVCNTGDPGLIPASGINLEKAMATHSSIYIRIFADIVKNTEIRPSSVI